MTLDIRLTGDIIPTTLLCHCSVANLLFFFKFRNWHVTPHLMLLLYH